jgi:hypothetical protein
MALSPEEPKKEKEEWIEAFKRKRDVYEPKELCDKDRHLFDRNGFELTVEEYIDVMHFRKMMYPRLLWLVKGRSIKEKEKVIGKLSFDERIGLIFDDEDIQVRINN